MVCFLHLLSLPYSPSVPIVKPFGSPVSRPYGLGYWDIPRTNGPSLHKSNTLRRMIVSAEGVTDLGWRVRGWFEGMP